MSSFFITDTLQIQVYITTCYEWMHAFSIKFWALSTELLRHLLALLHHFGICDNEDASSKGHKDECNLVSRPHTAWEMAALLQDFRWECLLQQPYGPDLEPSDLHFYGPLKMYLGAHRAKNGLKCNLQWFHAQCPEFYTESTHCEKCLNLKGDYMEKQASILSSL